MVLWYTPYTVGRVLVCVRPMGRTKGGSQWEGGVMEGMCNEKYTVYYQLIFLHQVCLQRVCKSDVDRFSRQMSIEDRKLVKWSKFGP